MTKKQVKDAIRRGLGRGFLAVREDPERYRDLVLRACERDFAYDAQSEGTRAQYVWRLISCYADRSAFRDRAIACFRAKKPDGGWDYAHLSELLMLFAEAGDQTAEAALWEKYAALFGAVKSFRRIGRGNWRTVECFETLCVAMSRNEENYARIAADLGGLLLQNSAYDASRFEWLYDSVPQNVEARLRRKAAASPELTALFAAIDALAAERETALKTRGELPPPAGGRRLSVYLKRAAPELAPTYAQAYLAETDPAARAAALEAFAVCPYPLDAAPLLEDAASAHPALRNAALDALAAIRDPAARQYALAHLGEDELRMLLILLANCLPEDEALLHERLAAWRIDAAGRSGWHKLHTKVLDLFYEEDGVPNPPKTLLPVLYETTLCSFCRGCSVELMRKYRMISEEMWTELLYDSSDEIRILAESHARRRRK